MSPWGWIPTAPAPPTVRPAAIFVRQGTPLQLVLDELPTSGGTVQLDRGEGRGVRLTVRLPSPVPRRS